MRTSIKKPVVKGAALAGERVQTSAHIGVEYAVYGSSHKVVAGQERTPYYWQVPEKEGNRFGSLKSQKRTYRAKRFFFVRMPLLAFYERRWRGSLWACWFSFVHQSSNPAICRPPRLEAGRGLTAQKEALMPSITATKHPKQFALSDTEVRMLNAFRNMDARRAEETLRFLEIQSSNHPRLVRPVFRLVDGGAV